MMRSEGRRPIPRGARCDLSDDGEWCSATRWPDRRSEGVDQSGLRSIGGSVLCTVRGRCLGRESRGLKGVVIGETGSASRDRTGGR